MNEARPAGARRGGTRRRSGQTRRAPGRERWGAGSRWWSPAGRPRGPATRQASPRAPRSNTRPSARSRFWITHLRPLLGPWSWPRPWRAGVQDADRSDQLFACARPPARGGTLHRPCDRPWPRITPRSGPQSPRTAIPHGTWPGWAPVAEAKVVRPMQGIGPGTSARRLEPARVAGVRCASANACAGRAHAMFAPPRVHLPQLVATIRSSGGDVPAACTIVDTAPLTAGSGPHVPLAEVAAALQEVWWVPDLSVDRMTSGAIVAPLAGYAAADERAQAWRRIAQRPATDVASRARGRWSDGGKRGRPPDLGSPHFVQVSLPLHPHFTQRRLG
jgi:hypothetical protein